MLSTALDNTSTSSSSPIFRSTKSPLALTHRPADGINTVYDIFHRGFTTTPDQPSFGQRRVVNVIEEQKMVTKRVPGGGEIEELKTWKFFELGPFEWLTWRDAQQISKAYASGYRALGVQTNDNLAIFADTSRDWMFTAMACFQQSITITTAYATLGEEGLIHSFNECDVSTVFTNAELLPMISKVFPHCKQLKNIVYNGVADVKIVDKLKAEFHHFRHLKVLSLFELKALGEKHLCEPAPPKKEDLALIMYTSGSTGTPKGVMLTHANVVAAVSGAVNLIQPYLSDDPEYYLAFLPLAHILEFANEMNLLSCNVRIGYGSVKTLSDASVRNCTGDIRELRPTVLAGVPAVWESIRKSVESKVRSASSVSQAVFYGAFHLKWALQSAGLEVLAAPLDAVVFNKIKEQLGGRLKVALSGGAPLPQSTQKFLSITAGRTINGYGMTECTAVLAIQEPSQFTTLGNTGAPVTSIDLKLVDSDSYKSTNLPKPQGEIWVRGPSVMKGYYKQPHLTAETITSDGWLMTGDIAEMNADGTISIIDRKKNLVKLSNGEYIAIEKLESNYKVSQYVQNICVHADSEQSFAVALIQPIELQIRALASTLHLYPDSPNLDHISFEELCLRPEIRAGVLSSLKDVAKSIGLQRAEIVGHISLCPEEWTPQNGMLTAAMKLQRKEIVSRFKVQIREMYSS
ncbi:long-chain fatty acid-CoA ligase [Podochytrium sp. JEL0797]|nr:long-chain fatty acid-CoA ligase [Podochytrium sp. JEL0797]